MKEVKNTSTKGDTSEKHQWALMLTDSQASPA